jgi:integrase
LPSKGRASSDIKVLQRRLGHSSAVLTLDRYGHLFPGQAESVANRLNEMAQAAGIVQRADVVAIDRGRS